MMKRSGKWYRKNEQDVMHMLGLEPTPNSGSGWIVKEDGQNENIICQLKSTDKQSIGIKKIDLDKLKLNAMTAHKIPVFAVQFITSGEVYLMVKPEDIEDIARHVAGLGLERRGEPLVHSEEKDEKNYVPPKRIISGASVSRERFHREQAKKYDKTRRAN